MAGADGLSGWQLVSLIIGALAFVAACGYSPSCSANMDKVYMLGSTIIGGVLSLAYARGSQGHGK